MESFSDKLIKAEDSQLIILPTTEKIGKKYFFKYLITQLQIKNIFVSKNSYFYSSFNKEKSFYSIILLQSSSKKFIYAPFILSSYYTNKSTQHTVDIFLCESFFAVFKDQKFFSFKTFDPNTSISYEDLKLFISQSYGWNVTNIIKISPKDFQLLKNKYIQTNKTSNEFKPFKQHHRAKYLLLFLFFNFFLFCYFLFLDLYKIKPINTQPQIPKTIQKQTYNNSSYFNIIKILKIVKDSNIHIKNFHYTNNKNTLTLYDKNKNKLLEFLKNFNSKSISITSITFDEHKNIYNLKLVIYNAQ